MTAGAANGNGYMRKIPLHQRTVDNWRRNLRPSDDRDIAHYSDDKSVIPRITKTRRQTSPDRIFSRPQLTRRFLAHNGDRLRIRTVGRREIASGQQGNLHRCKVVRLDRIPAYPYWMVRQR